MIFQTYLMASESICTGAILSKRNLTISRKGFVGCLGFASFRAISLYKNVRYKQELHSFYFFNMLGKLNIVTFFYHRDCLYNQRNVFKRGAVGISTPLLIMLYSKQTYLTKLFK